MSEICPKCSDEITNMNNNCGEGFYAGKYAVRMCNKCGEDWRDFESSNRDVLFEMFLNVERDASMRWIKVSERLPEEGIEVLLYFRDIASGYLEDVNACYRARATKHKNKYPVKYEWNVPCDIYFFSDVTHWMPLPPKPEDYE